MDHHYYEPPPGEAEVDIDWIFLYYGEGGNAADSTLWHVHQPYRVTGIHDGAGENAALPRASSLDQNYPNPFNPSTTIIYSLERSGRVSIEIRDVRGRLVKKFDAGEKESGTHSLVWDGRGDRGEPLPSGVYLYRLLAGRKASPARKMLLLRQRGIVLHLFATSGAGVLVRALEHSPDGLVHLGRFAVIQ